MEFLKTFGKKIINESGEEVILKGFGAGNWLNPEGFLFGTSIFGMNLNDFARADKMDRGRSINQTIVELCGRAYAASFWQRWYRNYLGEADIKNLAECGFNSIRLALNARVFLQEEPGYHYDEEMLAYLDQIIDWCEENRIYAILDMHAAVGAQSTIPCDDGQDNQPHLFIDEESWERTIVLWEKLARRYKDRGAVAGYELLNEPLSLGKWDCYLPELTRFYDETIARIRRIDTKHIIFLQGHRFAYRCESLRPDMDPGYHNWVLTMHMYETHPDLGIVGPFLEARDSLNVPMWLGESGGSNGYMTTLFEMMYENHIGVNVWCHKGVEDADASCLLTYQVPDGWKEITAYAHYGKSKPSYDRAMRIFDELLENVKFENCRRHTDRADAILRRPSLEIPAVGYDMLPGAGKSFQGNYKYCVFCGYRREDPMHIVYEKGFVPYETPAFAFAVEERAPKYGDWPHLELLLHENDFACYTIREIQEEAGVFLLYRADSDAEVELIIREERLRINVPASRELRKIKVGVLPKGEDTALKIQAAKGEVILRSVIID